MFMPRTEPLRDRFFAKIRRDPSGCIVWTGSLNSDGYGQIKAERSRALKLATHVSWFLKYGVWPNGSLMHSCDRPACVKPSHLSKGTQKQNMEDKVKKGRQLKGEQIEQSKLTEDQVREIRRLCVETSLTYKEIGKIYGLTHVNIWMVHKRRAWEWLDPHTPTGRKRTREADLRELSETSGLTIATLRARIKRGLTEEALVAGKHRAPRKPYTRRK